MTSLRMTSHCMTSCCGVLSLLGLCEKDCSINMLNFNKLRFIVNEIFDNSQLFLTDPRIGSEIVRYLAKRVVCSHIPEPWWGIFDTQKRHP